nr:PREDICTED: serine/threonine-protein kinase Nek7-like [Bemisia tabaci]
MSQAGEVEISTATHVPQDQQGQQDQQKGNSTGNFKVDKPIGKGNFSVVFKATCQTTGKLVALKKVYIYDMKDPEARVECIKEINLLKSLDHPNIVRYYSSFITPGELNIVLELADAGDLSRVIKNYISKRHLIPEPTIWKYFIQICNGIYFMHARRIMHRDIKPANIFIMGDGNIKVGDLGMGRYFSPKTLAAQTIIGTPYYMSPERIRGKGYDFKSDVWSLGCLLYEMASLQSPFAGQKTNLYALCRKIGNCDFAPIPSDCYSDQFQNLVECCMTPEATARPSIGYVRNVAAEMMALCSYKANNCFAGSNTSLQIDQAEGL